MKALGLINKPEDLRYAISSKADDYNKALEKMDNKMTINGHQFVMVKIDSKWIGINTSKGEWTAMPEGFSPDSIGPPKNIPVRFKSYPEVTLWTASFVVPGSFSTLLPNLKDGVYLAPNHGIEGGGKKPPRIMPGVIAPS